GVLTAVSDDEVRYAGIERDEADLAQQWRFVADESTAQPIYDGALINAGNGRALTVDGRSESDTPLRLGDPDGATRWMLESTTSTAAQGTPAFLLPVQVQFASGTDQVQVADVLQQQF